MAELMMDYKLIGNSCNSAPKTPAERKLKHPFAESTKWKQHLAESTSSAKPLLIC
jgi:hypothetical protein